MSRKRNFHLKGRNWVWGWHRYEAGAMQVLMGTTVTLFILGLVAGGFIGAQFELEAIYIGLIAVIFAIGFSIAGFAVARILLPPLWSFILNKQLDDEG